MQTYTLEIRDRRLTLASGDSTLVRTAQKADLLELLFYNDEWLDYELSCVLALNGEVAYTKDLVLEEPQEEGIEWAARSYVLVPDSLLESTGALGVTVHGFGDGDEHIITALSVPLEIMQEGDGIGVSPTQHP
jgi:hypothetical protein